ncbi:DegT/DnrJ/EryC1/StrS family aminotransferase [Spiractinospora alimapuensis]|uniref:DegT/DnrJ/EryC1/StrS family aminotransferase n=1 Tax=Spiractinospora alimapuensis TaxID=2820884 RepID=UPI001F2B6B99|nr:DegT/DnrJ/EryC1/StrS family aminotransferase [Spiractinospora alimapuensis]QVQ51820.1 DegT/DnrJ/EryC1/StrS family aminotransferase [Spiractinospora alimapuensis]
MTVDVWGYLDEYHEERAEILEAVDEVFASGRLILGAEVTRFENDFAGYHDVPHCVSVDNGTNAIVLALRALGVGPGDEVITVANTAAPTVVAIDAVGAKAVFADVDPDTYLMDVASLPGLISSRTRCVLVVHLYGQCVEMKPVLRVARANDLVVLEDCAQSHGARHHGRTCGTMGDAAAFSFYPTKVLGAYGDGGAVLSADATTDAALRRLRYYGMEDRYFVERLPGHNSRLDEVQAAILVRKLRRLDTYVARRRHIAERYADGLRDTDLVLPTVAPGNDHVYYLYVVRHPDRDRIIEEMARHSVRLNVSYRWPVHTMTGFRSLGYGAGSLPRTEKAAEGIFSLPMFPSLTDAAQDRVIEGLRKVLSAGG